MKIRQIKIFSIITFILIFFSLILIKNSPVTGYELSIYSSTNPILWIFLIMSNFFATIILANDKDNNAYNYIGFFILIVVNFIILSMSAMRGYFFYNIGDSLEHYNIISNIISKGLFGGDNVYPVTHVLIVQISEINNIPVQQIMGYIPPYFSVLSIMFVFLISRSVLQNNTQISLAIASSSVFLFSYYHVSVYPSGLSVLVLPLLFYLYFKSSNSFGFKTLFLILVILYIFFHPSTSLMVIIFLMTLESIKIIFKMYEKNSIKPILISSVLFILWNNESQFYRTTVKSIFPEQNNQESYFVSEGAKAVQNIHGIQLIELFIKMYGVHVIYSILSLLAIIIILKRGVFKNNDVRILNVFLLSAIFLVGMPANFIVFVTTKVVSVGRLLGLNQVMVLTPIFTGISFAELVKITKYKKMLTTIVVFIITLSFTLSMFSIYRSPWLFQQNWQATYSYVDGLNWFTKKSANLLSQGFGFYQSSNPAYYRFGNDLDYIIPEHFNYSYTDTFGKQISIRKYIIITEMSKLANANTVLADIRMDPAIQWGFNDRDFYKFENDDIAVDRLYSNGEFNVYLAEPKSKK